MKSCVRRRNTNMEESMEYMEVKHTSFAAQTAESHIVVPPFAASDVGCSDDVFSAPFCGGENNDITDIYDRPITRPKTYRPSSPDQDD